MSHKLLEDITSGDAHRIWASAGAIATLRDARELDILAAHLPEIEAKTEGIELGGAVFPNNAHLAFALRKLRYHQSGAGCLCRLYPERPFYDPAREQDAGNIRILGTEQSNGGNDFYNCQCVHCNTCFRVEEGDYHYTWWQWTLVHPDGGSGSAE